MNFGTIYLLAAAGLLFGAGFFAAKRAFPQVQSKQIAVIAFLALAMVGLIWGILDLAARRRETNPLTPATQPSPLQPNQDRP
jgi:hypothetical protein